MSTESRLAIGAVHRHLQEDPPLLVEPRTGATICLLRGDHASLTVVLQPLLPRAAIAPCNARQRPGLFVDSALDHGCSELGPRAGRASLWIVGSGALRGRLSVLRVARQCFHAAFEWASRHGVQIVEAHAPSAEPRRFLLTEVLTRTGEPR